MPILNGRLRIKLISNSVMNCGCGSDVIATSEARANSRGGTAPTVPGSFVRRSLKRIPHNAAAPRLRYKASALSDS